MSYVPPLAAWVEARLTEEDAGAACGTSEGEVARHRRRADALRALRSDPALADLRAGVVARLVEGERDAGILGWVAVEVLARRILGEAAR